MLKLRFTASRVLGEQLISLAASLSLLFSLTSTALAESLVVELRTESLSALSAQANRGDVSKQRAMSTVLDLPLPGNSSVQLVPQGASTINIPVSDSALQQSSVKQFVVVSASGTDGSEARLVVGESGIGGLIVKPEGDETDVYRIFPIFDETGKNLHEISEVRRSGTVCTAGEHDDEQPVDILTENDHRSLTAKSGPGLQMVQPRRQLQVLAFAPSGFVAGRLENQAAFEIASALTSAGYFFEPLSIELTLSGIISYTESVNDPFDAAYSNRSADAMLNSLAAVRRAGTFVEHDAAVVFGHGGGWLSDGFEIVGLANIGSLCTESAEAFVTSFPENGLATEYDIITLAHEFGHVVGMKHDDRIYPLGASIMYSGGTSANFFGFSARSMDEYQHYAGPGRIGSNCLTIQEGVDVTAPTIRVRSARMKTATRSAGSATVKGEASDDTGVASVLYRIGRNSTWRVAKGTANWNIKVAKKGRSSVMVYVKARDLSGNESAVIQKKVRFR